MEVSNLQIHPPANIIFAGASGSGKTTILARLLENKNRIFSTPPVHTLYCYRAWQSLYDEMKMKKTVSSFHQGLPSNQKIEEEANKYKRQNGMILILDDLVNEAFASNILDLVKLFTVSGHHLNITVIILLHNLFSKELRTISLNTHHFFITKNPRSFSQLQFFGREMFAGYKNFLPKAYRDATANKNYSYIYINTSQCVNDDLRVIANYFPPEHPIIIYQPIHTSDKMSNPFKKLVLIDEHAYNTYLDSVNSCSNSKSNSNSNSNINSVVYNNDLTHFTHGNPTHSTPSPYHPTPPPSSLPPPSQFPRSPQMDSLISNGSNQTDSTTTPLPPPPPPPSHTSDMTTQTPTQTTNISTQTSPPQTTNISTQTSLPQTTNISTQSSPQTSTIQTQTDNQTSMEAPASLPPSYNTQTVESMTQGNYPVYYPPPPPPPPPPSLPPLSSTPLHTSISNTSHPTPSPPSTIHQIPSTLTNVNTSEKNRSRKNRKPYTRKTKSKESNKWKTLKELKKEVLSNLKKSNKKNISPPSPTESIPLEWDYSDTRLHDHSTTPTPPPPPPPSLPPPPSISPPPPRSSKVKKESKNGKLVTVKVKKIPIKAKEKIKPKVKTSSSSLQVKDVEKMKAKVYGKNKSSHQPIPLIIPKSETRNSEKYNISDLPENKQIKRKLEDTRFPRERTAKKKRKWKLW